MDSHPWTLDEDEYPEDRHGRDTLAEIAAALGRTRSAVRGRVQRIGLAGGRGE